MLRTSRTTSATRTGSGGGIVVEGLDAVVSQFARKAGQLPLGAGAAAVAAAKAAADVQRRLVPIDEGDLLDSITADERPTIDAGSVHADAGPDPAANPGAFKGPLIEHGTVKMSPQPFVGPSADEAMPTFERALRNLT
jgi:hypothetical protein